MQNKTYLVTGASAGIGEATALELARQKANLILISRRKKKLDRLAKILTSIGATSVRVLALDINDHRHLKFEIEKKGLKALKSLDGLVNSAGLALGVGPFQDSKISENEKMLATNVSALMAVTHAFLPQLIKAQGHVVNLGSVAGRLVYEGGTVYCASKFAVRAFSEGLRMDLKGTGVRVTNIEPGMVNTEFSLVRLGSKQKADAVYAEMMPLGAEDIAKNILWCLQQPPHVNIQELVIYPTDQASVGQVVRGEKSIKNLNPVKHDRKVGGQIVNRNLPSRKK
jgi:3-hydroxy acid dehydrogenase / malonic semialdehyde reductase